MATSFDLKNHHQIIFMNHISIGTLSGTARIWDLKNIYIDKILQKKWSYVIKHSRRRDKVKKQVAAVLL